MPAHRYFVPFLLLALFLLMGETSLAITTKPFISYANTNYTNDIATANGKASERRNEDRISRPAPDGVVLGTSFPLHRTGRYLLNAPPPRWRRDGLVKGHSGARLAAVRSSVFGHFYSTPVKIGGKEFNLMIDTASSDTWVAGTDVGCIDKSTEEPIPRTDCGFQDFYKPGKDFKQIPINQTHFDIFYGDGRLARGGFGKVDVEIAGIKVNTQIAVAKTAAWEGDGTTSGMLGLAYPDITFSFSGSNLSYNNLSDNQAPYDPVFTTMWKQNRIPPLFSLAFNRPARSHRRSIPLLHGRVPDSQGGSRKQADGYLAFGGIPPVNTVGEWATAKIQIGKGEFGFLPTVNFPQLQWYTITPNAFLLGTIPNHPPKNLTTLPNPDNVQIMLDAGATQIYLPPLLANLTAAAYGPPAIWNESLSFYTVPCDATPPAFAIVIDGKTFPVDARDMIIEDETGGGGCMAGINNGGQYAPYVVGVQFLKNTLVVVDVGRGEVRVKARGKY